MRLDLGGHSVLLDKCGAAVLLSEKVAVFNRIPWNDAQRELFPTYSQKDHFLADVERLIAEHSVETLLFIGELAGETGSLAEFATNRGATAVWIGADAMPRTDAAVCVDRYSVGNLEIGRRCSGRPCLAGGWSPGDTGGRAFLFDGSCLLLPDLSNRRPDLPPDWSEHSVAYWLAPTGLVSGPFYAPRHSLR